MLCWICGQQDTPETMPAPLSGRQAEARRNDRLILEAAREVFVEDPDAPISAVAERAGVGIGALYRRYASKEELLRRLCSEGLRRYIAEAEAALARRRRPLGGLRGLHVPNRGRRHTLADATFGGNLHPNGGAVPG